MRRQALVILGAVMTSGTLGCSNTENPPAPEPEEVVEMAVLIVTAEYPPSLEGGVVMDVSPCTGCDEERAPISAIHESRGDEGSIALVHTASGDTLFAGTIWWSGPGARTYPHELDPAGAFAREDEPMAAPEEVEFLAPIGDPVEGAVWTFDSEKAWEAIADLSVVKRLAGGVSHVTVYRYLPSGSLGEPDGNRWVFLLYSRRVAEAAN